MRLIVVNYGIVYDINYLLTYTHTLVRHKNVWLGVTPKYVKTHL